MILLNEATTEQIVKELKDRSMYMALLINKPSNEGEFYTSWKGTYVEKMGMAHLLKTEMEAEDLHNHFEYLSGGDEDD